MDINLQIGQRVKALREEQGLSLDALAQRCGVSRSNISLIERGQSSPTATMLDKLSAGLGVSVASLFALDRAPPTAPQPLARVHEQALWTDPASGYVRRNVSPAGWPAPLHLVDVVFPAGQHVAFETGARDAEIHQQIWMIEGTMQISVGPDTWRLLAGDCLAMRLNQPLRFHNPSRQRARYLVAISNPAFSPLAASRSRRVP
jgi:transcriptional regulator with XRE-family HTH domain